LRVALDDCHRLYKVDEWERNSPCPVGGCYQTLTSCTKFAEEPNSS
jgi:hypothetical protein